MHATISSLFYGRVQGIHGIHRRCIDYNSGRARIAHILAPRCSLLFTEANIYHGHLFGRGEKGSSETAEEKYAEIYREARMDSRPADTAGSIMLHFISQIIDDVRARRKLCSPPPPRMVIWVTHPSVIHFAACCRYVHTCSRLVNISWWWNEPPVDDNVSRSLFKSETRMRPSVELRIVTCKSHNYEKCIFLRVLLLYFDIYLNAKISQRFRFLLHVMSRVCG